MTTSSSFESAQGSSLWKLARLPVSLLLGVVITLTLFWTMQYLIETADRTLEEGRTGQLLDFVRLKREEIVERKRDKPKKPPPAEAPPPEPPTPRLDSLDPKAEKIAISAAPVETQIDLTGGGFSLGIGEGDYLPLVKVAPIYPRRATTRGIEGYCIVEYTVTPQGSTEDVRVIETECTHQIFKKPSVQAAFKFKYKPRVIDGQAIRVPGVRNRFTYQLED